jgi:hypothetical protein
MDAGWDGQPTYVALIAEVRRELLDRIEGLAAEQIGVVRDVQDVSEALAVLQCTLRDRVADEMRSAQDDPGEGKWARPAAAADRGCRGLIGRRPATRPPPGRTRSPM